MSTVKATYLQHPSATSANLTLHSDGTVTSPSINPVTILGIGYAETFSNITGTVAIPADSTIPQITEGVQAVSVSYTPVSENSKLMVEAIVYAKENSNTADDITVALFRDSGPGAIAAVSGIRNAEDTLHYMMPAVIRVVVDSVSTAATSFSARAGLNNATTVRINGFEGNRTYGGVNGPCSITVTEYLP